jgi:hypothetical protein
VACSLVNCLAESDRIIFHIAFEWVALLKTRSKLEDKDFFKDLSYDKPNQVDARRTSNTNPARDDINLAQTEPKRPPLRHNRASSNAMVS